MLYENLWDFDVLKTRNSLAISNIYIIFAASINKFKLC